MVAYIPTPCLAGTSYSEKPVAIATSLSASPHFLWVDRPSSSLFACQLHAKKPPTFPVAQLSGNAIDLIM